MVTLRIDKRIDRDAASLYNTDGCLADREKNLGLLVCDQLFFSHGNE